MNIRNYILGGLAGIALAGSVNANAGEIYLPGIGTVDTKNKIPGSQHFTWGEATKDGTRIPKEYSIVKNIVETARYMEDVRHYFGDKPISITSWYRDPESNKQVGGAKESQHMSGKAVDFNVQGINPRAVASRMEKYWGSNGGLGAYNGWTHIDNRGKRARWSK